MHHLANYFVDATLHCYILPMEQGNAPECVGALLQAVDMGLGSYDYCCISVSHSSE